MSRTRKQPRIALALAGGGPLGAIYEIGALCALQDSLEGIDLAAIDHYIGVSAGGFIAAALANGMSPREICASFIDGETGDDVFDPAWLMVPAWGELARRAIMFPQLAGSALLRATWGRKPLSHALEHLGRALPTGLFSNDLVHERLSQVFSRSGRTNDFRRLRARLTLVATDLDSGEPAAFGTPGWDHVPISKAIQASSALPGLFPPVEIGDRYYVDGALKKTLHASVALDEGVDLLLALNPLVPFGAGASGIPRIADGGLPAVLSQTFRSMIHSRMELGLKHYESAYPATDIVLVEPDQRDAELFIANTFGYAGRRRMAEHAYRQTRAMLRERRDVLAPRIARHGLTIRASVMHDPTRELGSSRPRGRLAHAVSSLHDVLDDLGSRLQAA